MPRTLFPRVEYWSDRVQLAVLAGLLAALCVVVLVRIFAPAEPSWPLAWSLANASTPGDVIESDGGGMVARIPGDNRTVAFDVVARVPEAMRGQDIVALRFDRVALDRISVEDLATGVVVEDGFYRTNRERAPGLTSSYQFNVMVPAQGDLRLRIHATSETPTALTGGLESHLFAGREDRGITGTAVMSYAVHLVLALVMVALFIATGQPSMLAFAWFAFLRLLALMAINGHMYQIPGLAWVGRFGSHGILALMILAVAAGSVLLQAHGALLGEAHGERWRRLSRTIMVAAIAISAILLLLPRPAMVAWALGRCACLVFALFALAFCVRAFRNRIPHRLAVLLSVIAAFIAGLVHFGTDVGLIMGREWAGSLLQIMAAVLCTVLAISLVRRIGSYRVELARARHSHQQLRQQMTAQLAVRGLERELAQALPTIAESELEFAAIHRMLAAIENLLGSSGVGLVQFQGRRAPQLYALPATMVDQLRGWLAPRRNWVESVATAAAPVGNHTPVIGRGLRSTLVPAQALKGSHSVLVIEGAADAPILNAADHAALTGMANAVREALQHQRESRALQVTARIDALTGVLNRNSLDTALAAALAQAARLREPLAVLFLDIDHFKRINDRLGHAAGDECLRAVARLLRASLRSGDLLGRYGGEEFVVVSPGTRLAVAQQLGERIRAAVQALQLNWEGQSVPLTISIGIAMRRRDESQPAHLLDRADQALYDAKRRGRNQVRYDLDAAAFDPSGD